MKDLPRILSLPMWRHTDTTSIEMVWRPWQSTEVRRRRGKLQRQWESDRAQDLISYRVEIGQAAQPMWRAKQRKETKIALTVPTFMAFWDSRSWHHKKGSFLLRWIVLCDLWKPLKSERRDEKPGSMGAAFTDLSGSLVHLPSWTTLNNSDIFLGCGGAPHGNIWLLRA